MAISELQNFYKETIAVACTTGATNIYVTNKPTPTNGFLVISSGTESLREIIKYTGTGTDGTGDYVTVASAGDRGLGGTTDQSHVAGETVRMNYTAEHQAEIDDAIAAIVAGGAVDASTTNKGISKLSVAPASATEPIAVGTNDPRLNATAGLTADEEAALAGTSGAPSGTNKFVTNDDSSNAGVTDKIIRANGTKLPIGITQSVKAMSLAQSDTDLFGAVTTEETLATYLVPANALSTNRAVRLTIKVSDLTILSGAGSFTLRLKYGSTTLSTVVFPVPASNATMKGTIEATLIAKASASIQRSFLDVNLSTDELTAIAIGSGAAKYVRATSTGSATEDSTGALNLVLTGQFSGASAGHNFVPYITIVELIS